MPGRPSWGLEQPGHSLMDNDGHTALYDCGITCESCHGNPQAPPESALPPRPVTPDTDASSCPMPIADKPPAVIASCPGGRNRDWGLYNDWPGRLERARACRWAVLRWEGLSI